MFTGIGRFGVCLLILLVVLAPMEYQAMANPGSSPEESLQKLESTLDDAKNELEQSFKENGIVVQDSEGREVPVL